jgi:hypothetical protein
MNMNEPGHIFAFSFTISGSSWENTLSVFIQIIHRFRFSAFRFTIFTHMHVRSVPFTVASCNTNHDGAPPPRLGLGCPRSP